MTKRHMKRLAVPKAWPVKRKEEVFSPRATPGAHSFDNSVPLAILLRDMTKHAKTMKEVKFILHNNNVAVDGKRRWDRRLPVGYFDVLSLEDKEFYRVVFGKDQRLSAVKVDAKESQLKPCKIIGKTVVAKKKVQLNLYDGRNVIVDKDTYKVGDTVVVDLKEKKVKDHFAFGKGSLVFFTGGRHMATLGKVEDIQDDKVIFSRDGNHYRTSKDYAYVVGKDKPCVTVGEN